ncbi:hypothetical protein QL285_063102 [Trifolium repens]|nr:hypothetical protein QL285_063102 [Trifolium repens]
MATFPTVKVNACMIETENSIPTKFAKDQRSYKYDDLQFAVENPVDFEGLRVNGFPEVKELFEKQGLMYYFDILNGPTYTELIKEFWMKTSVVTRESYNANLKKLIKERPELQGKSHAAMGLRPFVSTEIESYVAGFRVSIRLVHIYEALKLSSDRLFLKTTDYVASDVEQFIYKDKPKPEAKHELTNICKVIYKILIDCIVPKLGGTDQLSVVQKLFTFHVGKGNLLDIAKLIFIHLLDAIESVKPIIHHSRLLSHMFAKCGLLDAVKPFFPGYGTYLTSTKVVNSTTLRYLHLVKNAKIVYPTHPLIIRETEDGIGECRLVHVSDRDARIIAEAHAKFLNDLGAEVGSGETGELSVRQSRILNQPSRVFLKRKAAKSPAKSRDKKVADDRNFYVIFSIIISSKMTKTSPNTKENLQKQEKASRQSPRCKKTRKSPKSEEIQHSIATRCVLSCHDESSLHAKQSEEINLEKIFHRSTMPYNAVRGCYLAPKLMKCTGSVIILN